MAMLLGVTLKRDELGLKVKAKCSLGTTREPSKLACDNLFDCAHGVR